MEEDDANNIDEENGVPLSTTMASMAAANDGIGKPTPSTNDGKVNSASELQSRGGEESEDLSDDEASEDDEGAISGKYEENMALKMSDSGKSFEHEEDEDVVAKKHKPLSSLAVVHLRTSSPNSERPTPESNGSCHSAAETPETTIVSAAKKYKKKNNLWAKSGRKGKKRQKNTTTGGVADDGVFIDPVPKLQPDKTDDSEDMKICLSKVSKAERVELSEDRMEAGSNKGYRMVRATRGVVEGSWYFEIRVMFLGESGHTRLGWSTDKGDLQAPVGYDGYSFGYRDIDGCRIHNAMREKYGDEGYGEGDVIGFYISLPHGSSYAPRPPHFVLYKGQKYSSSPLDSMEYPPQTIPGSEISFFKNGVFQGVAFKDLYGGRYFPAASFYTLPKHPNCTVKFNFGPDFEFFPETFDGRPHPQPMSEVPYHAPDDKDENEMTGKC